MYMLNVTIYCFKKKSEINVCFLLNIYSFLALRKGKQHPYGERLSPILCLPLYFDLLSARRFVATDALIVKFQNVDKQCIR